MPLRPLGYRKADIGSRVRARLNLIPARGEQDDRKQYRQAQVFRASGINSCSFPYSCYLYHRFLFFTCTGGPCTLICDREGTEPGNRLSPRFRLPDESSRQGHRDADEDIGYRSNSARPVSSGRHAAVRFFTCQHPSFLLPTLLPEP